MYQNVKQSRTKAIQYYDYKTRDILHTYYLRFIVECLAETSQLFLRDT
jgi:hypothetical protein